MFEARPLPFGRPRYELLLLVLVALAALTPVYSRNTQDISRLCLARALVAGHLSADACLGQTTDESLHGGHLYSDKAPGMSVVELIPAEIVRLPPPAEWHQKGDLRLWFVRVVASGLPFLLCVFLIGRIAEGLAPGWGAPALVTFGLGTQMGALGAAGFSHVLAGTLGFAAFVLVSRSRPLVAGLAAGAALATEYDLAVVLILVAGYAALRGWPAFGRYAAGAIPGVMLAGAYNWAAFGAPWHTPEVYSHFAAQQRSGVLGVHLPSLHGTGQVFLGDRGLLLVSPVLVAAALGLVLVWSRGFRAEALVCAAVTGAFTIAECGYFAPYGGDSPGPRFLVPALPFLALGLGPAFSRRPAITTALAAVSVVSSTAVLLSWMAGIHYRDTIWGEIVRVVPERGSARLMQTLPADVLTWGANRLIGAAVVCAFTLTAFLVATLPALRRPRAA